MAYWLMGMKSLTIRFNPFSSGPGIKDFIPMVMSSNAKRYFPKTAVKVELEETAPCSKIEIEWETGQQQKMDTLGLTYDQLVYKLERAQEQFLLVQALNSKADDEEPEGQQKSSKAKTPAKSTSRK